MSADASGPGPRIITSYLLFCMPSTKNHSKTLIHASQRSIQKPNNAPPNQNQYTERIKVRSVARIKGSLMTATFTIYVTSLLYVARPSVQKRNVVSSTRSSLPPSNMWRFNTADKIFTKKNKTSKRWTKYEGWNFNSGNYLFTTDTK